MAGGWWRADKAQVDVVIGSFFNPRLHAEKVRPFTGSLGPTDLFPKKGECCVSSLRTQRVVEKDASELKSELSVNSRPALLGGCSCHT